MSIKTKALKASYVNLSDFMEYLDEQELDDLNVILDAFTFGGCDMSLVSVRAFKYELCNAPRLSEKFRTLQERENIAFQFVNLSE
jgi:hypothetical protein